MPRSLSVQDVCVNSWWSELCGDWVPAWASGGAWARLRMVVGCARTLSLISVLGPVWLRVGDMMVGGRIPLVYAVRPLGL